ncbi:MAG: DNA mismatch repair protein MutS [Rhodobacteraceae bacterium]|nr:DNA mismatch repair protein MutS [Paracoccaceae bacterium]
MNQNNQNLTPMMAQYMEIKSQHQDALLFYRMGDFYEMFFDDAVEASEALDIALTKRGKTNNMDIPMCGVPVHAADQYLQLLIRKGFRVAVCEQTEDPSEAKKRGNKAIVRREVIRVITPGTLTEDSLLTANQNNYIAAIHQIRKSVALAWADISSGSFHVTSFPLVNLASQLSRISPKEVIYPETYSAQILGIVRETTDSLTPLADVHFDSRMAKRNLSEMYEVATLDSFGQFNRSELACLGAIVAYLEITQQGKIPKLQFPSREKSEDTLQIDAATRKNLEITRNLSGGKNNTLLSVLDKTRTASGARMLERWLVNPSTNLGLIAKRQNEVETFYLQSDSRREIRDKLKMVPDLQRSLSRLALERGGPRDLNAIKTGIKQAFLINQEVRVIDGISEQLKASLELLANLEGLVQDLSQALMPNVPLGTRDGDFIAKGFDEELDETRKLRDETRVVIAELEKKYAQLADIPRLKVRFNKVLGYYVETPSSFYSKMVSLPLSDTFIHRQSTSTACRFTSKELSDLESRIVNAQQKAVEIEVKLFEQFREAILAQANDIFFIAQTLSEMDVIATLAEIAHTNNWCKPVLDESCDLEIVAGRHPVVEESLHKNNQTPFVTNDCNISDEGRIILLTGPNMAGKSTFLRQNALLALLAQIGSYVPAKKARIGIISQLFSRVGAADDLAKGRSTFMVEMVETAAILNQADHRTLVILDEIGRGTATFDGLSIAWATLEYIHDKIKCRTLFATHFHELTELSNRLPHLFNLTIKVKEWQGDVVFLHEVVEGFADRSYGVQVAKLAGLPRAVVRRADAILKKLEQPRGKGKDNILSMYQELPLFAASFLFDEQPIEVEPSPVEKKVMNINPDELTPLEALSLLYELKETQVKSEEL